MGRLGYLSHVVSEVRDHFRDSVPSSNSNEIWYEASAEPLNWQLPAGVLFDLHCQGSAQKYPWRLTVHFQGFPSAEIVRPDGEKVMERHFFHSLKQGLFLEHGSSSTAMSMEATEMMRLWSTLRSVDGGAYNAVNKRLCRPSPAAVPVRVAFRASPVVQPLVNLSGKAADGHDTKRDSWTIGDLLMDIVGADVNARAVAHGVVLQNDAPLVEVWGALAHPDHFLYIAVVRI